MQPDNDPYNFILNPEKPKKGPIDIKANPKMLILFALFSVVIIIVFAVLLNLVISSGSNSQKSNLTEIAKAQTEIIRIASLPENNKSAGEPTKYLALNTKVSTLSAQSEVTTMLKSRGVKKINPKELATSKDASVDIALEKAAKNNKYNETYREILDKKLTNYQTLVKKAYDSGNRKEKASLKPIYEGIEALTSTTK